MNSTRLRWILVLLSAPFAMSAALELHEGGMHLLIALVLALFPYAFVISLITFFFSLYERDDHNDNA